MVTSESAKRASAALHARRKAEGWRKVTVWLSPEAVFKLDALKGAAGSADEAVRQALLGWAGPGGEALKPKQPVAVQPPTLDTPLRGASVYTRSSEPMRFPKAAPGARQKKGK